ncbi:MAG: tetratricopeptide repeat protein [Defluviicoccus sp.]
MEDLCLAWRPLQPVSGLLRASCAVVPYRERDAERADLLEWCVQPGSLGVRLYTGGAGSGKTRLLIECCTQLQRLGWRAGFLALPLAECGEGRWLAALATDRPLLIVIDDAPGHTQAIFALLAHLVRGDAADRHVRIVLLARARGDWWPLLCACEAGVGSLLRGRRTELPADDLLNLPLAMRRPFFEDALTAFSALLAPNRTAADPPDLEQPHFTHVFFVHAAALAAALGRTIQGVDELLDFMLRHDQENFWRPRLAGALPMPLFAQAATLATLAGEVAREAEAAAIVGRGRRLRDLPAETVGRAITLLRELYPPAPPIAAQVWLSGVQPALLAEHLVSRALAASTGLLKAAFDEVPARRAKHALGLLCRLAQRRPGEARWLAQALSVNLSDLAIPALQVAVETGEPAGQALTALIEAHPDPQIAGALLARIPWESHGLNELAVTLCRRLLKTLPSGANPQSADVARRAGLLMTLAKRLSDLGRERGAFAAAAESVSVLGKAAVAQPDGLRSELAGALSNYAVLLHAHGRTDHALASATAASDVYRILAGTNPGEFAAKLASCLETTARILSAAGRKDDSVAALVEATATRREIACRQPAVGRAPLAVTLNLLAGGLRSTGWRQDALAATSEAAEVLRALAKEQPDAFEPKLALCLNNLAIDLSACGRWAEAVAVAEDSVMRHRSLPRGRREARSEGLARALATLGNCYEGDGQLRIAMATFREAVATLTPRFMAEPDAMRSLMTAMIGDYRRSCARAGDAPDAVLLAPLEQRLSPPAASPALVATDAAR